IARMLFVLSTNLRYTISNISNEVTIKDEVNWLENYIYLQKIRFQDRFDVFFQIDVNIYDKKIHRLILQPFVENAILHGFKNMESGGILNINGYLENNKLCFEIVDNGCGFQTEIRSEE